MQRGKKLLALLAVVPLLVSLFGASAKAAETGTTSSKATTETTTSSEKGGEGGPTGDGPTLVDEESVLVGQDIKYVLSFQVPNSQKIEQLYFYDDLEEEALVVKSAIMFNQKGEDITDKGKLEINESTQKVVWTPNDPTIWYGQKLGMQIIAYIKDDARFKEEWKQPDGSYKIPNVGHMVVNDKDTETPPVVVIPPTPNVPAVVKKVSADGKEFSDKVKIEKGKEYTYRVTFTVTNTKKLEKLEFFDDLEDIQNLLSVEMTDYEGNKLPEDFGKMEIDDNKESWVYTVANPTAAVGKKYIAIIKAKIKEDVDDSDWKSGDEYVVPNVANMRINGDDIPSNKTEVNYPPEEETIETTTPPLSPKQPSQPNQPNQPAQTKNAPQLPDTASYPQMGQAMAKHPFLTGFVIIAAGCGAFYIYKRKRKA